MVRKILAHILVMCMCFTGTDIVCAQPTSRPSIKIPKEIASVNERIVGTKKGLVIHIQDAHTSFEAQENIAKLIAHLVKTDATRMVSVEGAEGPLQVEPLRLFPRSEIRWKTAESMMAYGYLTGAEVAAVGMEQKVAFVGAENIKLYKRNLRKFQAIVSKRADIIKELEELEYAIDDLKTPLYSPEMLALDACIAQYYDGKLNFIDFARQVLAAAEAQKADVFEYPNVGLFVESLEQSRGEDTGKRADIEKDRTALMLALLNVVRDENVLRLLQKLSVSADRVSEEKQLLLDSFLLKQLRLNHLVEADYAVFVQHARFAEKFGRIDKAALIDELEQFSVALLKAGAGGRAAVIEHVELSAALRLMRNLIELKVVPEQVAAFDLTADTYSSVRFMNFLREQSKLYNLNYHPSSRIGVVDEVLEVAKEFYRYAEARSKILVDNTIDQMVVNGEQAIVLVAGGYHTDGILKEVERQGYSCMVLSPSITNTKLTVPYIERMMDMKSAAEMRFESAFNTIVKQSLMDASNDINPELKSLYFTIFNAANVGRELNEYTSKRPLAELTGLLRCVDSLVASAAASFAKLDDLKVIYSNTVPAGTVQVISKKYNLKATLYLDPEHYDCNSTWVSGPTAEELAACEGVPTIGEMRDQLVRDMIALKFDPSAIAARPQLLGEVEGLLAAVANGFMTDAALESSLLEFYQLAAAEKKARADEQATAGLRLFDASNVTAVLSVGTIKAIGGAEDPAVPNEEALKRGAQAFAGMVRRDTVYAGGYNDLFGQLIKNAKEQHEVVVVCSNDIEKKLIREALAGVQSPYAVRIETVEGLVSDKRAALDLSFQIAVEAVKADAAGKNKNTTIVVGALQGEIEAANNQVFTFSAEGLKKYVGGDDAVRLNLVDALLAAGQDKNTNVVSMIFEQLLNLKGRIIERLAAAFNTIKNSDVFKVAA